MKKHKLPGTVIALGLVESVADAVASFLNLWAGSFDRNWLLG